MEEVKDNMRNRNCIEIGQLPRYSRPIHVLYSNSHGTQCMEPINIWSDNLSLLKDQKEDEEKLLTK